MLQERLELQIGKLIVENHVLAERLEASELKVKKLEEDLAKLKKPEEKSDKE